MRALASKWGNYSNDDSLVSALKMVPFIPQWNCESNGYWECEYEAPARVAGKFLLICI
jgi:hypothetical protein